MFEEGNNQKDWALEDAEISNQSSINKFILNMGSIISVLFPMGLMFIIQLMMDAKARRDSSILLSVPYYSETTYMVLAMALVFAMATLTILCCRNGGKRKRKSIILIIIIVLLTGGLVFTNTSYEYVKKDGIYIENVVATKIISFDDFQKEAVFTITTHLIPTSRHSWGPENVYTLELIDSNGFKINIFNGIAAFGDQNLDKIPKILNLLNSHGIKVEINDEATNFLKIKNLGGN